MQEIGEPVEQPIARRAAAPVFEFPFAAELQIALESLVELARDGAIEHTDADLFVERERAGIEIRRAHVGPRAIDDHDLLMDQRAVVFVDPDAGLEQAL